ncbi:ATP-binding cassette domain-containing protein [Vagococcus sp. BWB3-3]|uniref:ATP-binding cassette domain-containing protein n=1 Tax=Vagococcus allomyrinae TaxID=2794353 RepID=A0A940PJA0_9ENTE|nr:ATP-binding cassette domain-containing protein [Vagococcus allomyrinae]MBP1044601.1 ATP-binding cassette domain-containing protein [Vagococcus allomyrinae]
MNAIEVKNLEVVYPEFTLDKIEFNVPSGSIVGFVGENGAGKTTTIKAILNLISHAKGSVSIYGLDNQEQELAIKKQIGVVLDDAFFYEDFTTKEIATVLVKMYHNWDQPYFNELLKAHGITESKVLKELSKGMKAKVKIFAALAHHPRLLILDEPTTGLDPVSRDEILDIFYDFIEEDKAILFSSHITSDIEKIADSVIFIDRGKIVLTTDQAEFQEDFGIAKLTASQLADIGEIDYLYRLKTAISTQYLISNRRMFLKEYPDIVVEKATIEATLLMIKKGEVR